YLTPSTRLTRPTGLSKHRPHIRPGPALGALVQFDVLASRSVPGKVLPHALGLYFLPVTGTGKGRLRPFHGFEERRGRVRPELEAGSRAGGGIVIGNGVVESSSRAHDRHRAVAHAVH